MADSTPDPNDLEATKRVMRRTQRVRLDRVLLAEAEAAGRDALAHLSADSRWAAAGRVGVFASEAFEPATRRIVESVLDSGRTPLLPRCISNREMEFAPIRSWAELEPGRYGLLEPTAEAFDGCWDTGDLVVTPGLAFDRHGGRLGRGAGFYDRCLAGCARGVPWLIGFGFSFQIVGEVPMGEHDRRLDGVLSEAGLRWIDPA